MTVDVIISSVLLMNFLPSDANWFLTTLFNAAVCGPRLFLLGYSSLHFVLSFVLTFGDQEMFKAQQRHGKLHLNQPWSSPEVFRRCFVLMEMLVSRNVWNISPINIMIGCIRFVSVAINLRL